MNKTADNQEEDKKESETDTMMREIKKNERLRDADDLDIQRRLERKRRKEEGDKKTVIRMKWDK